MSPAARDPWYIGAQQNDEHLFRAICEGGCCSDCLGGPDAPAHVRAAERAEFAADMAEIECFGEVIFNAVDFMVEIGMTPTILAPPCVQVEVALRAVALRDDPACEKLRAWRESRTAA